eukprot:g5076.t1
MAHEAREEPVAVPVPAAVVLLLALFVDATAAAGLCLHKPALSWFDARARCQAQGGDLVSIRDNATLDSVHAATRGQQTTVWLGITDSASEGSWVNVDGSSIPFVRWGTGEPNDVGGGEDCAELASDARLNDQACTKKRAFVCRNSTCAVCVPGQYHHGPACLECPAGKYQDRAGEGDCRDCAAGWFNEQRGQSAAALHTTPLSWPDARARCQAQGGDLLAVTDKAALDNVARMLESRGHKDRVWLGATDRAREGTWTNVDGSMPFLAWASGQPDNWGGGEDCIELANDARLNDQACTTKRAFVCSHAACKACAHGQYQQSVGQASCIASCPAGKFMTPASPAPKPVCKSCDVDRGSGSSSCCAAGEAPRYSLLDADDSSCGNIITDADECKSALSALDLAERFDFQGVLSDAQPAGKLGYERGVILRTARAAAQYDVLFDTGNQEPGVPQGSIRERQADRAMNLLRSEVMQLTSGRLAFNNRVSTL